MIAYFVKRYLHPPYGFCLFLENIFFNSTIIGIPMTKNKLTSKIFLMENILISLTTECRSSRTSIANAEQIRNNV